MKIYIVQQTTGSWEDTYTINIKAFLSEEKAVKYVNKLNLFLIDVSMTEGVIRSCLYELYKLGAGYGWKDTWEDNWPSFNIDILEVE